LPSPIQTSAILNPGPPKKEETPILDFMFDFEDDLFAEYGNTLKYHTMRKPQKSSFCKETLDLLRKLSLKSL